MWIIETSDLRKQFKDFVAVHGVSFKVKEGEIFGFLGPNGAGKTTVINMLTTMLLPTSGKAKVVGYDVAKNPDLVRKEIGVLPQEVVLEDRLTARENLEFYAKLYHVPKKETDETIPKLLKLVDLADKEDVLVGTFSGGMKRRLEMAKSFIHSPKMIFLDEPTIGLDPQTRRAMWGYIKHLNEEQHVTIFLTTHYLEEADFLCSRVAIIDHGKIKALNTPAKLKENLSKGSIIDLHVDSRKEKLMKRLHELGYKPQFTNSNTIRVLVSRSKKAVPQLFKIADGLNINIHSISMHEPSLEDVFIHYTGRAIRDEEGQRQDRALRAFR